MTVSADAADGASAVEKGCCRPRQCSNHVSNVFTGLEAAGRAEAVAQARDASLGAD